MVVDKRRVALTQRSPMTPSTSAVPSATLFMLLFVITCSSLLRFALQGNPGSVPVRCSDPRRGSTGVGCSNAGVPLVDGRRWLFGAKVPLASATERDLVAIPGVGPSLARSILEERRRRGGFRDLSELRGVHGVGPVLQVRLGAALEVGASYGGAGVIEAPAAPPSAPAP